MSAFGASHHAAVRMGEVGGYLLLEAERLQDLDGHGVVHIEMKVLEHIFNYDGYDNEIARFFVDYADELHLHSCFYCETAYVNVYDIAGNSKKYFDLDHVLPKSKCPILALSLFNFVPSCQVCNSRIKKSIPIGKDLGERKVLSPTSNLYDFENNVRFRLRPQNNKEFKQLEAFVAAVDYNSFSEAAKHLYLTQPTVPRACIS